MADTARNDIWAQGTAYERYVGRWSRRIADEFLTWLAIQPGQSWLDVGCGTGALTQCILEQAAPARIVGVDSSESFVAHASARVTDGRVQFRVGDARALPVEDRSFDVVASGLVLNFVPDQPEAVAEMRRAARPGGTIAFYVWDYANGMEMMRRFWEAAIALDPAARDLDEGRRFTVCQPDPLHQLLVDNCHSDIAITAIDVPTVFENFEDFWSPFLGGQGPAPSYCMKLSAADRTALRDRLQSSLPTNSDGRIALTARAWAARGIV